MASVKLKTTKAGKEYYEIRVSMGRNEKGIDQFVCRRWYAPEGWSQRTIDRELAKVAAEIERQSKAGEIKSRRAREAEAERQEQERTRILTLESYANKVFMPSLAITCSESCRSNYQHNLELHIFPELGSFKITDITPSQITALLLQKQKEGLKVSSCLKLYTILNSLFKKAYLSDAIEKNPMDKVQRPKATKSEGRENQVKAYTERELRYIIECVKKEPLQWQALINLLIDTGCRRGEITGLKWDCVDFEEGLIIIKRNLCYTPEAGIYLDTPKNGKSRKIFLAPEVLALLKDLKASQRFNVIVFSRDVGNNGFVFTQEGTNIPMHPDTPTRYFARFGKRYGIDNFHPHKLRHSFASVAIKNGADIASVSEKLGHSDKALTLRMYTHADEESQKRAGEIFRSAIFANG